MGAHHLPQSLEASVVEPLRTSHAADRPRQLKGWRTVRELRDELRFPSDKACRAWLTRQGIVCVRRGRIILVDGLDVDAALRKHATRHVSDSSRNQT